METIRDNFRPIKTKNVQKENFNSEPAYLIDSLPAKIDIYDQAYLIKLSSSFQSASFNADKNKDLAVAFNLNGELKGTILSVLQISKLNLNMGKLELIKSTFIESMNILLGNFLTNLENNKGHMAMIGEPKVFDQKNQLPDYLKFSSNYKHHFKINYFFLIEGLELNSTIYFQVNSPNVNQV